MADTKQPETDKTSNGKPIELSVCEECKTNLWKYKCPGCSIRTCGLPCVKSHKNRTGCNGKRNVTKFVPISQFDDNLLLSDYNMLEEVKRVAESAQRIRTTLSRYPSFKLPFFLRSLRSAAASRRTRLLYLPSGMSKREKNQTRYDHRKKCISWTIEWRFHSTNVILFDNGVSEDTTLCSVIENHLKPGPWNHALKPFCDTQLDSLKFFIRKYPKGSKSPFRELNIKAPLRHQLTNIVILEYPVIYVFLPSHPQDFEVSRDIIPVNLKPELKDPRDDGDGHGSPKGVTFTEEMIEEDDLSCLEPKVLDLVKEVNFNRGRFAEGVPKTSRSEFDANSELEDGENMDFELDQGLIDLIAETNPGDLFDFEGGFAKGIQGDEMSKPLEFVDELEEGEIPDS